MAAARLGDIEWTLAKNGTAAGDETMEMSVFFSLFHRLWQAPSYTQPVMKKAFLLTLTVALALVGSASARTKKVIVIVVGNPPPISHD